MEQHVDTAETLSPLMLLTEGREQVIKVDFKNILTRVMAVVGVSPAPVFNQIDCGEEGVKVSVDLNANFPNHSDLPVFQGRAFMTVAAAEANAVMQVFRYLEQNGLVKVVDFSSRVAFSYTNSKSNTDAAELSSSVSEVLDHFESSLQKCTEFLTHVQADGQPYDCVRDFVQALVKDYSSQLSSIRSKVNKIEFERRTQQSIHAELTHVAEQKVFFKKVHLTSKLLLDYVLVFLGLRNAKYNNGPDCNSLVDAVVVFTVPYSKHRKYGGNIQITAKGKSSSSAEENAAYKALVFIQENFGVIFVDLNYCQRIDAENDHFKLKSMIVELVRAGKICKEMWDSFLKTLSDKIEELRLISNSAILKDDRGVVSLAYKFLVQQMEMIEHDGMETIDARWAMTDLIDGITQKMDGINLDLQSA